MSDEEIKKAVDFYTQKESDNKFIAGWNKFVEIISLSKTGSTTADLSQTVEKTSDEWKSPDGITIQTSNLGFILKKGLLMFLITFCSSGCTIAAMFMSSKIISAKYCAVLYLIKLKDIRLRNLINSVRQVLSRVLQTTLTRYKTYS